MDKQAPAGAQDPARDTKGKRFGGNCALTAGHKLPAPETEALQAPEPDGTEDPGASADDALMSGPGKD
ncbi:MULTISPECIES: hypothetical protein [unclassified Herbaspirillum]|uniref:hypothetical protein n=1 Tax=unclassified Herbaspirillum TaxID=2624150 RepID=UPI001167FD83|nr:MULTISPECIES: hypothetical protein [unclassified Herbaspirillum]MBB5393427.1 hypothetical protein [Herbaspirillum sp. SJZ102]TQK03825.1 hypothetical protein FB599_3391 [Herbaspirillum sp. SJZ130]TQK08557.1 hypothetical protein FB598_3330 [Herbaspirillum sp. SJZ106]TWC71828.1 hypothetical protein FB597_101809 [Herbaspirillum sp. SJZ099]